MKTKEELLKIYSAYLPYELIVIQKFGRYSPTKEDVLEIDDLKTFSMHTIFRPHLYSMDMLTKEIEHKGERFVAGLMLVDPDKDEWDKMICEAYKPFRGMATEYIRVMHESLGEIISINPKNVGHLPYNIFIKLLELNFNVFGLEESEYIKKESLC